MPARCSCVLSDSSPEAGVAPPGLTQRYVPYRVTELAPGRCEDVRYRIESNGGDFDREFPRGLHSAINNSPYRIQFYRGRSCSGGIVRTVRTMDIGRNFPDGIESFKPLEVTALV